MIATADPRPAIREARADFSGKLRAAGVGELVRKRVITLQLNVGKLCNMACHHCHVDAGPKRTEIMAPEVAIRVVQILADNPGVECLDLTGGAPELNPGFRWLVSEARRLRRRVIDRCNLTVLAEPGMDDLAWFLAEHRVEVVASLPCYLPENVERQRGKGAFSKSIEALRALNALGYGRSDSGLVLNLVYNPLGPSLPPPQDDLQAAYRRELGDVFGIAFNRLLTITNMPIKRFAALLARTGRYEAYMSLLVNHFNAVTVPELMCRTLLSVAWDGGLYDCDFNQMLGLRLGAETGRAPRTIWDVGSLDALFGARVATGPHCFGCTAGAGSSCGGALL
ncbi:MAG: arsenosugar biosynthesis radical SAM protein ArsS [Candidatus Schekmanbacteria bacterium]|nr:arsenosugar biosynthesis radical SAM protein ArsS [Candidatus Schekmanbacteria bacterium]